MWHGKRTLIAQSVDNLGDQFRSAMRAGWLSYIRRVHREEDSAAYVGLAVGEAPWWSMIESTPLLDAANTVLP
jgi:hypothetical protein